MSDDVGKLVLRLALGILILLHGLAKIAGGVSGIEKMLEGVGLPATIAWGVYLGEVLAPLLVILGFYARIGAIVIMINMLFAIGLAHTADVFALSKTGGWAIELQAMFLFTALAIALIGPGRYAINRN
ncbi:MAG TPA: DoxX family protein [Burkholderiales bacterium]|nr:DoxX family protein [Burkholderiales bacterium]